MKEHEKKAVVAVWPMLSAHLINDIEDECLDAGYTDKQMKQVKDKEVVFIT